MSEEVTTGSEQNRSKCEVYSRVVGYIRPVSQWNEGKRAEYDDRIEFKSSNCVI